MNYTNTCQSGWCHERSKRMKAIPDHNFETFIQTAHVAASFGLVLLASGNLSMRIDEDRMLISASGASLSTLDRKRIVVCSIHNGEPLPERSSGASPMLPSIEVHLHTAILRARQDMRMVLHFQSPYATMAACRPDKDLNYHVIPEVPFFIGSIKTVDFHLPGSQELAEEIARAMEECNLVVMRNHGQVTGGRDADELLTRAVFFELTCRILASVENPTSIPPQELIVMQRRGREARGSSI
jgi:L-fuculose-phosphate aldolase